MANGTRELIGDSDNAEGFFLSVPIVKIDRAKREVWGFATVEEEDQQGEVVDYDASKRAFSKWAGEFQKATAGRPVEEQSLGNLREMHQPIAVGKAIAIQFDDKKKGIWVGGRLSNSPDGENSWQKVNEGILTGFSIGAPQAKRVMEYDPRTNKKTTRVVDFNLSEVSLVDNPACPSARIHEIKLAKGMLAPMEEDAAPPGERKNAAAPAVGVGARINPNAFVDDEGQIWKMIDGRISNVGNKEDAMHQTVTAGQPDRAAAKAANIGPVQQTGSSPAPGVDLPSVAEGETTMGVKPGASSTKGVPPAGAGHSGEVATVSVPDGQGKAAAMPPQPGSPFGTQNPAAPAAPGQGGYQYCAMCGGKLANGATAPFHPEHGPAAAPAPAPAPMQPHPAAPAAQPAPMMRAAETNATEGLEKVLAPAFTGFQKAMLDTLEKAMTTKLGPIEKSVTELAQRMKRIEDSPTPGGPVRTELLEGVRAVEKGTVDIEESGIQKREAILQAAMGAVADPFTRDKISIELAKSAATREFRKRDTRIG